MKILINILSLLNPSQKARMCVIFLLMFILIFLEVLSIGLIIPIATIFTSFDTLLSFEIINTIFIYLGEPSKIELFLYAITLFFLIIVLKSIFSIFIIWQQTRFSFDLMRYLSQKMFRKYLENPWEYHLTHNSSILIRNVLESPV